MEKIESAYNALKYLKSNCVLIGSSNTLFKYKDKNVVVKGKDFDAKISTSDFLELYSNETFQVKEEEDTLAIDFERDKEYYETSYLKK